MNMRDAFEHNAWATQTIFDVAIGLPEGKQTEPIGDAYMSVSGIAAHLVDAEASFLRVLGGDEVPAEAQSINEAKAVASNVADAFSRWFQGAGSADGERVVHIPWLERDLSQEETLFQVLYHSTQHRAEMALLASMAGAEIPFTDYILWKTGYVGRDA